MESVKKPVLYLFVGYPGAGKTTAAQLIHDRTGAVHLWADQERRRMFGQPVHSAAENRQLYAHLNDLTGRLLGQGKSVIFDTNFNFFKDRQHLREIAAQQHADTKLIWVTTPKALAKRRSVQESSNQATRLYGNMPISDFERIAGHLEPPTEDEESIKIDGTELDGQVLMRQLGL